MTLNLQDKKAIVAEVSAVAKDAISLVVADYRGISVPKMTALRQEARSKNIYLRVVRNTLAVRALKGTDFECMDDALVGPLLYGFAHNEPSAVARLFKDFAKDNKAFEVKALSVAGQRYEASDLDKVASLPTKDEALGQLAGTLMAPINQLARTLAEPYAQLARALDDYRKKKEEA